MAMNSRHPDRVASCRSPDGTFCDAGIRMHISCGSLRWQWSFADQGTGRIVGWNKKRDSL